MRLRDLDPSFIRVFDDDQGHTRYEHLPSIDGAQGLMFNCPNPNFGHIHVVWFANPVNASLAEPHRVPTPRWQRSGMTLDDLTLAPSIDSKDCWHGHITNGVVT